MATQTAKQWQMAGFGRDQLRLVEVPVPQPGPHEVLVKVAAVSLNYRDQLTIANGMGSQLAFPFVPGSDMAGTVAQIGPGVSRVGVGQRVINTFWTTWLDTPLPTTPTLGTAFGGPLPGVFSQYLVLHEDHLVNAPETLDDSAASTLTCAGLTAWFALVNTGHLQAGQTVLVQGSGGVALFAAQLALSHGAQVVLTSASAQKRAQAKALGVQHVIDRTQPDWPAAVLAATEGRGVDHAIELAGGENIKHTLDALAIGGRIAIIGVFEGFQLEIPTPQMFARRARIEGIGVGNRKALRELAQWIDLKGIKPVIDAEYALADLPAALAHLERGAFGKVVVRMTP
ncbi:zinc-dependent alcohol dehydrogenase family protein [Silvimonas amylolytica]|uniref:Alcohol dehydrogenase n=1 Tax=Silvimonas amylolytica TaxID=449663 RepID=A0ABQ2PLJ3_9NEIS|nr:NAD(P)-dependent alcohol dehydrogenase [Silvimonas amylolytica]GGP26488.1 alcohol dehydrogenase [Silvimonas amylolytica]